MVGPGRFLLGPAYSKGRQNSMLCNEGTLVNLGAHGARAVSLRCRSWGCPLCQPERQRQLVALAASGKPTVFITLTSNPRIGSSPASRARALAKAWPVIVRRACAKYGYKSIPYFCVFEATKKGEPHLHILARVKWIDQRWLSNQMRDLTGSPIVDIRVVRSVKEAASYLSKYIGKEPHRFKTCKRYWRTKSWDQSKFEKEPMEGDWSNIWELRDRSLASVVACWECLGWAIVHHGSMVEGVHREAPP